MYSNYCRHSLLCTKICVCMCYELSMSINIVQSSTQTEKKANSHNIHSLSDLSTLELKHTRPTTFSSHKGFDFTWC